MASAGFVQLLSYTVLTEGLIARRRQERESAILRLSAANAAWEEASRNRSAGAARLEDARASLKQALASTDFSGPEDAEEALLDPKTEEELEKEIRLWRENSAALDTQIAEQEKQLAAIRRELSGILPAGQNRNIPTLEEAERRLDTLKTERVNADEEKNRAFAALTNLEKEKEALEETQKRHDALAAEARKFRILSDDLSGKNPRKIPFDS